MTFDELLAEVYTLTNRSDLIAETKLAVKAATLKAHKLDFWPKDIYETGIEFTTTDFRQSLDYISIIPNYRALKYVRRVIDENDDVGKFFDILLPEEILDSYGRNKTDIAYVAGRVLEMRSSVTFTKILVGMYVLPIVEEVKYSSWVADLSPYTIVLEAARMVFKTTGDSVQEKAYRELVAEDYIDFKKSALVDVGY